MNAKLFMALAVVLAATMTVSNALDLGGLLPDLDLSVLTDLIDSVIDLLTKLQEVIGELIPKVTGILKDLLTQVVTLIQQLLASLNGVLAGLTDGALGL